LYTTVKIIYYSKRDNINLVKNILLGEEARQKGKAIVAKNNNNQSAHALQAGRGGKGSPDCRDSKKGKGKRGPTCYRCDKDGHTAPYYTAPPKVKETNSDKGLNSPSKSKTIGRDKPRISLMAHREYHPGQETESRKPEAHALTICLIDQISWYFDLGVSDYITGNIAVFDALTDITLFPITIGDESQCWVTGKGPVTLTVASGKEITISKVLYS